MISYAHVLSPCTSNPNKSGVGEGLGAFSTRGNLHPFSSGNNKIASRTRLFPSVAAQGNLAGGSSPQKGIRLHLFFLKRILVILFVDRGREGEREGEKNINVCLPLKHSLLGTWLKTQACALTGNQTRNPLVCRPALNPLSHTSQGRLHLLKGIINLWIF